MIPLKINKTLFGLKASEFFFISVDVFHLVCREIIENGHKEIFTDILKRAKHDWEESKLTNIDRTERQRCADVYFNALCCQALFCDNLGDFDKESSKSITETSDPKGYIAILQVTHTYLLCQTTDIPLDIPSNRHNEDRDLIAQLYAFETKLMASFAKIVYLQKQTIENKARMQQLASTRNEIFEQLDEIDSQFCQKHNNDGSTDVILDHFLNRRKCMKALCSLGLTLDLGYVDITILEENINIGRECIQHLVQMDVWNKMTVKWKILTIGAICKWFCKVHDRKSAMYYATKLKDITELAAQCITTNMRENIKYMLECVDGLLDRPQSTIDPLLKSGTEFTFDIEDFKTSLSDIRIEGDYLVMEILKTSSQSTCFRYPIVPPLDYLKGCKGDADMSSEAKKGIPYQDLPELNLKLLPDQKKREVILCRAIGEVSIEEVKRFLQNEDYTLNIDWKKIFYVAFECITPDITKTLADAVCENFKKYMHLKYKHLLFKTWLGYFPDNQLLFENIRIVAFYNSDNCLPRPSKFQGIPIRWQKNFEVSKEARETLHYEDFSINAGIRQQISAKEIQSLFENHSNLNLLHPSSFKSANFSTDKHSVTIGPCIALYCELKGIIPIGEHPFPKTIAGFPTDVREGYCFDLKGFLHSGTAIMCTCESINKIGTLGGFVKNSSNDIAFVTAAHVVANCSLLRKNKTDIQSSLKCNRINVSINSNPTEVIGTVIDVCFEHSNCNETSIDAAVVKVNDPEMVSDEAMFPHGDTANWNDAGYSRGHIPRVCSNALLTNADILSNRRADVIKYGTSTDLTIGRLAISESYLRIHNKDVQYIDRDSSGTVQDRQNVIMCKQMGVRSIRRENNFSEDGDSGAFCYMIDKDDDMKMSPFGMVIAGCSSGITLVTPLVDVFPKLNLNIGDGLELFPLYQIHTVPQNTEQTTAVLDSASAPISDSSSLDEMLKTMMTKVSQGFVDQNKKMDEQFGKIAQQLQTQENLIATNHDKVVREISDIKSDVEVLKKKTSSDTDMETNE